jgi:hypothetical protein
MISKDIRRIQSALDRQSFKLNITGVWDNATCHALLAFQTSKYGGAKKQYLDAETFMDLGFDARTSDAFELAYGHICGGVDVAPATYGNTVGTSMAPAVKLIQRALRLKETGKLDSKTCSRLSELARNNNEKALITRSGLERLGFTSTEAIKVANQFAFAQCPTGGRVNVAGVRLDYPGFSRVRGFAGADADAYGQSDQDPEDAYEWEYDQSEDVKDWEAVWNAVLPAGHHWCTATPSSLRVVGDWILVDSSANGIKRRQYSDNVGAVYYQFWRTINNEERWACPKTTALTSRKRALIKMMQEALLDLGYKIKVDSLAGKNTCTAAYSEQLKLGICGQELLQQKLFQRLGFTDKEVAEAWKEISGVCRGEYTSAFACIPAGTPPEPVVVPDKTPPKSCMVNLPVGMVWCDGQLTGAVRISGPNPVTDCTGWTQENWKSPDGSLSVHFYNIAAKTSKWACAIKLDIKDDLKPTTNKAGWGWLGGLAIMLAGAGFLLFGKPVESSSKRRR